LTRREDLVSEIELADLFALQVVNVDFAMVASALDLDVDASRQVELHQRVQRLRGRLEDVDQALVRAHLELLARLLVDVRSAEHGVLADRRRQRDRARDASAGAARGLDDVRRGLVEQLVIERLEADSDLVVASAMS
jgi:hypothetical protein